MAMRSSMASPSAAASPRPSSLSAPPRSPAPTPRAASSADVFYSPLGTSSRPLGTSSRVLATSSRPLETSSRSLAVGGYINVADQSPASVLQSVKNIQARVEETERAHHRQALEREDLEQQLRVERDQRQALQQLVYEEQEERRELTNTVAKLQAALEESLTSTAAAHRQMSAVPQELERLENEVRLCARVEETQGWLGELERQIYQRVNQTATALDEYHQDFTDTSSSLANALKSRQSQLTECVDAQTKLRGTVHDLGLQLETHRIETSNTLRGVAENHSATREQLDERCDSLNGRADALVAAVTDLNATLRAQLRADVDAVKSTLANNATTQSARVQTVQDQIESQVTSLRQSMEENLTSLQEHIGEGLERAEKRREESVASERSARSTEVDAVRDKMTSDVKALGDNLAASIDKIQARCGVVEEGISSGSAELSSAVAKFEASIAAEQEERLAALKALREATEASSVALEKTTSAKIDISAAEIDSACARMNADIAQTAQDVLAIRTVLDAKIEQECEVLETSVQRLDRTFGEQLSSFKEDMNGKVVTRLEDFDGKLKGVFDRLAPCEDKLLEAATRAEIKSQTIVIGMQVADVEGAVTQLQNHLEEIEETWGTKLGNFEADLTDMSTDFSILEATVTSVR